MKKIGEKIYTWVDERYDLSPILKFMSEKNVPVHHHTVWYYMGGVTLFLFITQVVTGILLLFYYRPGADSAYESMRFILTEVNFGWLIRSIHSWSANLMVFFVFVHMFSTFFTRSYIKPRELTWLTGFALLALSLGFGFSGYLLPWNELAFFATKVGTDIVGVIPVIGKPIMAVLRGGEDVTGATLTRFYAFHVAMLPAIFTVILFVHVLFVQKQGMSEPEGLSKTKKTMPFFPDFFLRDALLWMIVLNVLLFLAVFYPWDLGFKADPFSPAPAGILPEWYFIFMFQTLKMIPAHVLIFEGEVLGILFFMIAGLAWALVPFWELKSKRKGLSNPMNIVGIISIIYIIIMTIIGYTS
ncbi:MAG: cytochrome bc complex cytochrome b subunit [bacterium]|nr:MAG: cytochrome bc complex cytochrome b subunit [bacterium]